MPWVKVDDGFPDHEKVAIAGAKLKQPSPSTGTGRVVAVWTAAMAYCNKHLTDGFISDAIIARFHVDKDPSKVMAAMTGRKGLTRRVRGGFEMVNYHDYQPSKQEVEEKRQKERQRKKVSRATSARTIGGRGADVPRSPHGESAESAISDPIRSDPALTDPEVDQVPRAPHAALTPIPRNALGDVRVHLMAACHGLIESDDPTFKNDDGQPAMGAIVDELKWIAKRDLNADWDFSSEIQAIYTATVKTREMRMAKARTA